MRIIYGTMWKENNTPMCHIMEKRDKKIIVFGSISYTLFSFRCHYMLLGEQQNAERNAGQ